MQALYKSAIQFFLVKKDSKPESEEKGDLVFEFESVLSYPVLYCRLKPKCDLRFVESFILGFERIIILG